MFISLFKLLAVNVNPLSDQGKVVSTREILSLANSNDLDIKHIRIDFNNILFREEEAIETEEEFNQIGVAIAKSSSLRSVILTGSLCKKSCKCIYRFLDQLSQDNRYICSLRLHFLPPDFASINVYKVICRLGPFLRQNIALSCLELTLRSSWNVRCIKAIMVTLACRSHPLETLRMDSGKIDDDCVKEFVQHLNKKPVMSPKFITLEKNCIGNDGCIFLSEIILNPNIKMSGIKLGLNPIGTLGIRNIVNPIIRTGFTLESLSIGSSEVGIQAGQAMREVVKAFLANPDILPNYLEFPNTSFDTLKDLGNLLTRRNSPIQRLVINNGVVQCNGLFVFIEALLKRPSSTPKELHLVGTFGTTGYEFTDYINISNLLRKPDCTLEVLNMPGRRLRDNPRYGIVSHMARNLENNSTLREFLPRTSVDTASTSGWDSVACLLCNVGSIDATFTSNHTIVAFGRQSSAQHAIIRLCLAMNRNPDKKLVARIKVIGFHFVFNFNLEPFIGMQFPLLSEYLHCINRVFRHYNEFFERQQEFCSCDESNTKNNLLSIYFLILKNTLIGAL